MLNIVEVDEMFVAIVVVDVEEGWQDQDLEDALEDASSRKWSWPNQSDGSLQHQG